MPPDGSRTRASLLEAAEDLFAGRGFDGVSLREVSTTAGQGNNNAAAYHFRSHEGLIVGLLERRMGPIAERRAALLDRLAEPTDLDALVRCMVVPFVEASKTHPRYAAFIGHLYLDRQYAHLLARPGPWAASLQATVDRIQALVPDVATAESAERMWLCGVVIANGTAAFEGAQRGQPYRSRRRLVESLVTTCTAIITAP